MNILHPHVLCPWLDALHVAARREQHGLALDYHLRGDLDRLLLPPEAPRCPTDGLWRHTCFEVFVMGDDAPAYREFNFSPSGAWAAYRFSSCRQGMTPLDLPDPGIVVQANATELRLQAHLADLPPGPWHLALAAVVEDRAGGLSYWALHHPGSKPDFHHPAAFTLELP